MSDFRFPVSLQPIYTAKGYEVPRVRAVVRDDTREPLAAVSHKYRLISHSEIVDGAQKFLSEFGDREEHFFLARGGARLVYQSTYRSNDSALRIRTGDIVGLRVYVENSYNASSSVVVRIGFLVLSCLNGMVAPRDVFCFTCRHTGNADLSFPNPDSVYGAYKSQIHRIDGLTERMLPTRDIPRLMLSAEANGLLPSSGVDKVMDKVLPQKEISAWDLMQAFTYFTTHQSKASPIGKINRLERIDRWFSEVFRGDGYKKLVEESQDIVIA